MIDDNEYKSKPTVGTELSDKSLSDLRVIAQSYGVADIFEKDKNNLLQEIEIKQQKFYRPEVELPPKPVYDMRLASAGPSERTDYEEINEVMLPYIEMGLKLRFDEERWYMSYNSRTDEGTIRMPLRTVMRCADMLISGKR